MSDGLPLEFDRTGRLEEHIDWNLNGSMYDKLEEAVGEIVMGSKPRPNVLVVDTFYPWASKIAKKFGLYHASFWTEPALVFNLYYHVHLLREHAHFDCPDRRKDPINYIPGLKSIEPKDLMSYLQEKNTSTNMHELIFTSFEDVRFADCVLCNTVQDLESDTVLILKKLMPFYPIGPIFRTELSSNKVHTSLWCESSCTNWLDQQPDGSVLYVSFGSLANFTQDDLMEFAYGLKLSNVSFVWVLRPRTVLDEHGELLPEGFDEEFNGRGVVLPWTDQIAILSHRAIAGFLTHCGWNSVLESVWNQIPMLCFPVFGDQPTNRKLIVDEWRIGTNLCDGTSMKRKDIASKIQSFMSQKSRVEFCKNIQELRKLLENTLDIEGSSVKNTDVFIKNLEMYWS